MPVSVLIAFDRPHAAYFAGERVSGTVVVRADKPKRLRAISVTFKGEAKTHWSKRRSNGDTHETVKYSSEELYFNSRHNIAGGPSGDMTLPPGEHHFPFGFALPASLPSSLEGHKLGHVRYTVHALLHRPWRFDHGAKAAFSVTALVDLNAIPDAKQPIALEDTVSIFQLFGKSKSLTMTVRLPASGFVPGETVPMQIDVVNDTKEAAYRVMVRLDKEVEWKARSWMSTDFKSQKDAVLQLNLGSVPARSRRSFTQGLRVPALPPSNVGRPCKIIDMQYSLVVQAELPGMGMLGSNKAKVRASVVVGTVPLRPVQAQPQPSAPPLPGPAYPESPPPRYEECLFSRSPNIMDGEGDNQYTMGARAFAPRYPVYDLPPAQAVLQDLGQAG